MTDVGVKGFRVQVTERRSGRSYDLRHSGLSYDAGLPGGFKTCVFTCATSDCSGPDRNVDYLDDITVFYGDDVAWEGQVEEVAPDGRVVTFTCLGYAVTLKGQPLGVLFIDRQFERWRDDTVSYTNVIQYAKNEFMSFDAPVSDAVDGATAKFLGGVNDWKFISGETAIRRATYFPPWGAKVRKISFTYRRALQAPASGTAVVALNSIQALSGNDQNVPIYNQWSVGSNLVSTSGTASGSGTLTASLDLSATPAWFVGIWVMYDGTWAAAFTPTVTQYFQWFNEVVLGEAHPDTGLVLDEGDMSVDRMIRSVLATRILVPRVRSSDEAIAPGRYLVQQATFDEATPETIIQRLCDLVGWEWGVFDGRRMYAGPPETVTALGFRDPAVFDAPPWYMSLRAEDGHNIMVAESAANVINQVQMKTVGKATGIRHETVYTNFNDSRCPLNQPGSVPLEVRSRVVDAPEGFGQDDIAVYAAALLARFAAPQITGEVVISQPLVSRVDMGTTTPFLIGVSEIGGPDTLGGRPMEFQTTVDAPLIRPGWWCHFPDLDTTLDESAFTIESGRRPMGGLGMVRNVTVEAGDGGAVVTLTLDDGSTRFDTAVAQFIEGRI